ncbi:MAG: ribonucleotide-diphosphate reductase subunit beta [Myxococcota bacterium]
MHTKTEAATSSSHINGTPAREGAQILRPGLDLVLRPMKYPVFYEMYKDAVKNTWSVEEVDFSGDIADLDKLSSAEQHLIKRLVAFFATADTIVLQNQEENISSHVQPPEAKMYIARQEFEEALHMDFYLTLLDTYVPDLQEREEAFAAVHSIPSIKLKADFCLRWMQSIEHIKQLQTAEHRRLFLLNLICYASCIEGLFFFAAFAYVYFLRSKGLLHGLATGTNWVFRDESCHINFACEVIQTCRREEPSLFDEQLNQQVQQMMQDAIACELQFGEDVLSVNDQSPSGRIAGFPLADLEQYLQYVADLNLEKMGFEPQYHVDNPFSFMRLQDMQELTNFFERRVSAYQTSVSGDVSLNEDF